MVYLLNLSKAYTYNVYNFSIFSVSERLCPKVLLYMYDDEFDEKEVKL